MSESPENTANAALTDAYRSRFYFVPMAREVCKTWGVEPTVEWWDTVCEGIGRDLIEPNFIRTVREVTAEIGMAA